MINLAIFISGRIKFYDKCLLKIINFLKSQNKYNIKLFLSINSDKVYNEVIQCFKDEIGYSEFKPFFYEEDWIENRLKNNRKFLGPYNQLSCFYNDLNNFNLIEKYEKDNNIEFDVLCRLRSDLIFNNLNEVNFHKDNPDDLILNNINLKCRINAFHLSPPLVSELCFGNKKSMKLHCNTYNFMKNMDVKLNGLYNRTFEPYLSESLYNCLIYGDGLKNLIPDISPYTKEEFIDIFNHKYTPTDKKFIRKDYNWKYILLQRQEDHKIYDYTPPKDKYIIINNEKYIWTDKNKPHFTRTQGFVNADYLNAPHYHI